ncbi:hypothetical protein [Desulfatitalea tepidiphila]|uniref:hypothetical protein n=1 Tax=Desulfatitalea tepidiphila TaxID=1185843 RepID=UPI00128EC3C4|nr:hypothetical protein [Desulfatitalea tepidiphila]
MADIVFQSPPPVPLQPIAGRKRERHDGQQLNALIKQMGVNIVGAFCFIGGDGFTSVGMVEGLIENHSGGFIHSRFASFAKRISIQISFGHNDQQFQLQDENVFIGHGTHILRWCPTSNPTATHRYHSCSFAQRSSESTADKAGFLLSDSAAFSQGKAKLGSFPRKEMDSLK